MKNTYDILERVVEGAKCFPNWRFFLREEEGHMSLIVEITGTDNYNRLQPLKINHFHPVPCTTYNEQSWRRWLMEQCLRTMTHELGENLRFGYDEVRPFAPMHGPGEDPYTLHEIRPERDALTTQDGSLREGPV